MGRALRLLAQGLEYVQSRVVISRRIEVAIAVGCLPYPRNLSFQRRQRLHRSVTEHDAAGDREEAELI